MVEDSPAAVQGALARKRDLITLVVVAMIIAFAVATLSTVLVESRALGLWALATGATLILLAGAWLLLRQIAEALAFSDELHCLVFLDPQTNKVLSVKEYRFSDRLAEVMKAIQVESKSIYAEWERIPLIERRRAAANSQPNEDNTTKFFAITRSPGSPTQLVNQSAIGILEEAALFVIIKELSLHLDSYFGMADEVRIKEIRREDMPQFLLSNRIMNLLSTPIEQRDIFLNAFPDPTKRPTGEIMGVYGSDGSVYTKFDLRLPAKSRISRTGPSGISISTSRLELSINLKYTGYTGVISTSFAKNYMGRAWKDTEARTLVVKVHGRIKALSLLRSAGWEYYHWLDSLRVRLRSGFDFDAFKKEIHWDVIEPLLHSMKDQTRSTINQNSDGPPSQALAAKPNGDTPPVNKK